MFFNGCPEPRQAWFRKGGTPGCSGHAGVLGRSHFGQSAYGQQGEEGSKFIAWRGRLCATLGPGAPWQPGLGSPLQPRAPATSRCSDTQGDRGERPAGPPQAPLFKDKTQRETAPSPGPSAARGWGSLAPLHWAALLPTGWHRAGQRRREVSTQRKPGLQAQKLPHLRACVTPGESLPLAGLVKAPP